MTLWSVRSLASIALVSLVATTACGGDDPPPPVQTPSPAPTPTPTPTPTPVTARLDFSFGRDDDGFTPEISEYGQDQDLSTFEFEVGIETVPHIGGLGFRLYSVNRSDDAFMYLWKPMSGLTPNQQYRIEARVRFATNTPPGCFGAGGSPSEVVIQAGASPVEPKLILSQDPGSEGTLRPNFDHGTQNPDDPSPFNLGVIAQNVASGRCDGTDPFRTKELATDPANAPVVISDGQGRLWVFMGTDSNQEGATTIYWLSGTFIFTPTQ